MGARNDVRVVFHHCRTRVRASLSDQDATAQSSLNGDHEEAMVLAIRVQSGVLICRIEPGEGLGTARAKVHAGW